MPLHSSHHATVHTVPFAKLEEMVNAGKGVALTVFLAWTTILKHRSLVPGLVTGYDVMYANITFN